MAKGVFEPDLEVCEMIDESDSTEDSDDEDYELGDNLFSKASSKVSKPKSSTTKKYNFKLLRKKLGSVSRKTKRKLDVHRETKDDTLSPPNTSRLFQIVIARKHARLSSCLQRTYLSLASDDKFVTIAEVLSFVCECAGFKPNLVNRRYLSTDSEKKDSQSGTISSEITLDNFGWDSFRNCYLSLPSSVTYEDVLRYRDKPDPEDEAIYGKNINSEDCDSISSLFYNMSNYRIRNLTKMLEGKEGWMIDLGSVGFVRFCEFFNELVLQAETQYFKDLLELIQWVLALSLCPYRPIRLLSCVACNEMVSSLLAKLDTLRKDQVVLKKQLQVEAELDKRMSGRLGKSAVSLSGSTLELYKRLTLVNTTCKVVSSFVKATFSINYSSKLFDVSQDIRMLSAYYMVVHYLINPSMYEHSLYVELVGRFVLNQDENLVLLLKYLLVYRGRIGHKVVDKLLAIYPNARGEANELIEFILLKFLNEENKGESDGGSATRKEAVSKSDEIEADEVSRTKNKVAEKLLNDDFVYESVINRNSVYFCSLFLSTHFPSYRFTVTFNLNLAQIKSRFGYLMNEKNKAYNNHVYTYTRVGSEDGGGQKDEEEEEVRKMKLLCKLLSKHQRRARFKKFLNNMVLSLMKLDFFSWSLSGIKFRNYSRLATVLECQGVYNQVLLAVTDNVGVKAREGAESAFENHEEERVRSMEDFVKNSHEVYRLNKNSTSNLSCIFGIYRNLLKHKPGRVHKLADLIISKLNYILEHADLTSKAINILSSMLTDGSGLLEVERRRISGAERSREVGSETESISSLERYKAKINSVFKSNVVKLVKHIESGFGEDELVGGYKGSKSVTNHSLSTREETQNVKLVIFALNQFLTAFNFVTLSSNDILTIYNLLEKERVDERLSDDRVVRMFRRSGLYWELLILYYLVYEHVIYNTVSDGKYQFERLDELGHKLLCLMLNAANFRKSRRMFVALSSAFNVMKLSNSGFLHRKGGLKLEEGVVDHLERCIMHLLEEAYRTREGGQGKESRDGQFKRKERTLSLENDGGISVNYKYYFDEECLRHLTPVYIAESLIYQCVKTLNSELFNSNMSVALVVSSCGGVERLRKASLKYLEILNRLDLWLFNLVTLHTMFTLYELSENVLLERVVSTFNSFQNERYHQAIYHAMQYINKSQSNEKFLRYLTMMAVSNVSVRSRLLRCIRVNATTGTRRYNVVKIIARILRSVDMDDRSFNSNLLFLRRSLDAKAVERLCRLVERSIQQGAKATRTTEKSAQGPLVAEPLGSTQLPPAESQALKRTKVSSRSTLDDTTLVPDDCGSFNDNTTDGAPMDEDGNFENDDNEFLITNDGDTVKQPLAPSVGIRNKIPPIELRDDELDLSDIQGVDEYEPVFDSLSEGEDAEPPKSSCVPSQRLKP
ncbi:uncharacterized protein TOT_040000687 [Theileria orientalis strain Shintoku]|uniref:STAG domain-containing protein n=1 Tax=Theileria orientalis strain Shintoku TaxID=869250 RepID=J7MEZ2_THEOR|nr:uncharacterized protein TOT_040000687 [Theileria orientalis strain Shintoku]BAM42319.1 uncharacterized protein TOT_040000687 [Theileria orientalis strain Shintoku]|eukprot:XP_009692620.1 uncharacterized protein TOT_040000687 [Theileria orientalis strain Shintoku]